MRRSGEAGSFRRAETRVTRFASRAVETVESLPGAGRVITELVRVEFIDRTVVVAAQSLFALVPLMMVAGAFAPASIRDGVLEQVADLMAIQDSQLDSVQASISAEQMRAQTGLIGALVVLVSATSFARSLQRMFERTWEQPHQGGLPGLRRSLTWLVACVVYLQALALLLAVVSGFPGSSVLRLCGQVAASSLLWWWSARVLLRGREPWGRLWPSAVLTGLGLAVLTHGSQYVMPPYVRSNVEQFGALGIVFAASTWLLAFGGVLVVAGVLGRVIVEDPTLRGVLEIPAKLQKLHKRRQRGSPV